MSVYSPLHSFHPYSSHSKIVKSLENGKQVSETVKMNDLESLREEEFEESKRISNILFLENQRVSNFNLEANHTDNKFF